MKTYTMDLRSATNPACKKCDRKDRDELTDDGLCRVAPSVYDGLPVRCVGEWAYDKIFHLHQYLGIFARGMRSKWQGLNYIEICAGPGRCILKERGEEVDGTSLAVIHHPDFNWISSALFIDNNPEAVAVLTERIRRAGHGGKARAIMGDYTDPAGIVQAIKALPTGRLTLVLIDPTDCSIPLDTVAGIINGLGAVDLIINLPIYMDAGRNLLKAAAHPKKYLRAREKYTRFLGCPEFFELPAVKGACADGDDLRMRLAFRDKYREQLATIGHLHSGLRPISHYYELLFASRHERGMEFWNKACAFAPNGQKDFFSQL